MTGVAPAKPHRPMYGESGYERRAADAYWTPSWCVDVLLRHIRLPNNQPVWEPACGTGNICRALSEVRIENIGIDLHQHGYGASPIDFLQSDPPGEISAIITNPPYELGDEFVAHALELMRPRHGLVAMLLRNEWDAAASRTPLLADLTLKLVLTKRPRWSDDERASPRHNFAWFVWNFSRPCGPAYIIWDRP